MADRKVYKHTLRKHREIRDIFNHLRKKYRADAVTNFISTNYFITPGKVYHVLTYADTNPVTEPSMVYTIAMSPDFHL